MRPAHNLKPATYTCPLCRRHLLALTDHVLIAPEGDTSRAAATPTPSACSPRAGQGTLPTEEEWRATQPRPPSLWRRLLGR